MKALPKIHVIEVCVAAKTPNTVFDIFKGVKQLPLTAQRYGNDLSKQKRKATSQSKIQYLTFLLVTLVQIESCWCQLHFVWIFTGLAEITVRPPGF